MNQQVITNWGRTGLVGTIAYQLFDSSNTPLNSLTTAGITESPASSGIYVFTLTWNNAWPGVRVLWSDGTSQVSEWLDSPLSLFTGPRSVTLHFVDNNNVAVPNVIFYIQNVGSTVTDVNGTKVVNLADGIYTISAFSTASNIWSDAVIVVSGNNSFTITASAAATILAPILSLSSVAAADAYFNSRLYATVWFAQDSDTKQRALNDATRIIDRLRFKGYKTVATQIHEWPRSNLYFGTSPFTCSTQLLDPNTIPDDILNAQYEIAFALVNGIEIEREVKSKAIISRAYSSVRIAYNPNYAPINMVWGVPSFVAWNFLIIYLDDGFMSTIRLHRVS